MLNILIITSTIPYPPNEGSHIRSYNLLKYLSKYYHFFIVGQSPSKNYQQEAKNLSVKTNFSEIYPIHFNNKLQKAINRNSIWWLLYKYGMPNQIYGSYKNIQNIINKIIKEKLINAIIVEHLTNLQYVKQNKKIPVMFVAHHIENVYFDRIVRNDNNFVKKIFNIWQKYWLSKFESNLKKYTDLIITTSENDKKILETMNPKVEIQVIPNGVDTKYFIPNNTYQENNHLLFTGFMDHYPNHQAMLYFIKDIWPNLKKKKPNIKLTIAGKHPRSELINLAQLDSSILLTGEVNDMRPYLEKATIYIAPILSGSGTRTKILEAMSMKKAIISTSIGVEGLLVENNKNVLIADDIEKFIYYIVFLFNNPSKRKLIEENARILVNEKYNWQTIAEKQKLLIDKLLKLNN